MVVQLAVAPAMACGAVYIFWVNKAIHGYDPVAYFTEGKPVRVKNDYSLNWNGARWLFAGTANRDKFKVSKKKFMPQYGGYCAWAASLGGKRLQTFPMPGRFSTAGFICLNPRVSNAGG